MKKPNLLEEYKNRIRWMEQQLSYLSKRNGKLFLALQEANPKHPIVLEALDDN